MFPSAYFVSSFVCSFVRSFTRSRVPPLHKDNVTTYKPASPPPPPLVELACKRANTPARCNSRSSKLPRERKVSKPARECELDPTLLPLSCRLMNPVLDPYDDEDVRLAAFSRWLSVLEASKETPRRPSRAVMGVVSFGTGVAFLVLNLSGLMVLACFTCVRRSGWVGWCN